MTKSRYTPTDEFELEEGFTPAEEQLPAEPVTWASGTDFATPGSSSTVKVTLLYALGENTSFVLLMTEDENIRIASLENLPDREYAHTEQFEISRSVFEGFEKPYPWSEECSKIEDIEDCKAVQKKLWFKGFFDKDFLREDPTKAQGVLARFTADPSKAYRLLLGD
jgi:hypothetical protein